MDSDILIEARGLKKYFPIRGGLLQREVASVKAVDNLNFYIRKGETVGLVGESGCGKTTTGRCILHLTKPSGGRVYYKLPADVRQKLIKLENELKVIEDDPSKKVEADQIKDEIEGINQEYSLESKNAEALRQMRRNMQIVFQDPFSSLNPRMLVKNIVGEPLLVHGVARGDDLEARVINLMETVGLNPEHLYRFPHEFSGGQRQRIGVARALSLNPELVVLDEPTSALDVSVQAQILNMLNDLQEQFNLTYLFISHDLSTIRYMCDRVNVMYLGKIVESAHKNDLFEHPLHPYTEALLSVIPSADPDLKRQKIALTGEIPSPASPPTCCRFHTRCKYRDTICEIQEPELIDLGNEHFVACHFRGKH